MRERIDKEIDYLAHEIVVPITGEPSTPYEFDALKKYKAELGLFADHIRGMICQEIEKVENPYPRNGIQNPMRSFEACRQEILARLRGEDAHE